MIAPQLKAGLDLLIKAGFKLDGNQLKSPSGEPLTFEILTQTREQERVALAYQRTLRAIGVDASVRSVDSSEYDKRWKTFDFDMTMWSWGASLSPGQRAAQPLDKCSRRSAGLAQSARRQVAGCRCGDRGAGWRHHAGGSCRSLARARPGAALGLLCRAFVPCAEPMGCALVAKSRIRRNRPSSAWFWPAWWVRPGEAQ